MHSSVFSKVRLKDTEQDPVIDQAQINQASDAGPDSKSDGKSQAVLSEALMSDQFIQLYRHRKNDLLHNDEFKRLQSSRRRARCRGASSLVDGGLVDVDACFSVLELGVCWCIGSMASVQLILFCHP
jgi:hypothetical protein